MNDAQRYRMNAAECLSAAEQRQSPYRSSAFTMAAYWLSLARQQEAVESLLGNGREAQDITAAALSEGSNLHLVRAAERA
jgi:hypothetical protein